MRPQMPKQISLAEGASPNAVTGHLAAASCSQRTCGGDCQSRSPLSEACWTTATAIRSTTRLPCWPPDACSGWTRSDSPSP